VRRPLAFRVELARQVGRRRTQWSFALLLALPLILVAAFWIGSRQSGPASANPSAGSRMVDLAQQGSANFTVFALFAASDFLLVVLAALFGGDTLPSEAAWSSLRYLLAAPVPRARLLTSKLVVAIGTTALAAVLLPAWSLLVGGLAYGWSPYTSAGGIGLTWEQFLPRLALAVAAIAITLLRIVGIAFLIGTRTDSPLAAAGGAVLVSIVSTILESIEALGSLRNALPMAYSRSWVEALSLEIGWSTLLHGALWSLLYATATIAAAYVLFSRKDVLS